MSRIDEIFKENTKEKKEKKEEVKDIKNLSVI